MRSFTARDKRPLRLAINGFGRIGRTIVRQALETPDVEICLINDIAGIDTAAYLFQYDSIFGPWRGSVISGSDGLRISGRVLRFSAEEDVDLLNLRDIDVLLDCTGKEGAGPRAARCLNAGCGRVLISGPAVDADILLVMGANEERYRQERIVSNGSCTTNALAPLLKVVDELFSVIGGQMTTVHCYTASQPTIDQPRADLARSRAAGLSMIPTTTSAHHLLSLVLPDLAGRIEARAIRVPTASVSAIDLTVATRHASDIASVRMDLRSATTASSVIGWIDQPLVSVDMRGRPESLVLSGPQISLAPGGLLRVFGWYDNEWAFAARMLDMAGYIARIDGVNYDA